MPTTVIETDAFVASLQQPNNGELADAASILLYLQHLSNTRRFLYNRHRSNVFDVTRAPFNADRTGAADSRTAIQSALDAASVAGGYVYAPGGSYRLDSSLLFYPGVKLVGDHDRTIFSINHATESLLTLNGPGAEIPAVVEGIHFRSAVPNTGNLINGAGGQHGIVFDKCRFGDNINTRGTLLQCSNADLAVTLRDCRLLPYTDRRAINQSAGRVVLGGATRLVMPQPYTSGGMITITGGRLVVGDGVEFDGSANLSGVNTCYGIDATGPTTEVSVGAARFDMANSAGRAINIGAGSPRIRVSEACDFTIGTTRYKASGVAGEDSQLSLYPHIVQQTSGTTITVFTGVRTVVLLVSAASAPTITLPSPLNKGQQLTLLVRNTYGSGWGGSFFITDALHITGTVPHPVLSAPGLSCKVDLIWSDMFAPGATWSWVVTDIQYV